MAEFRLETQRLLLRNWREEDREPFAAMNADPLVMEYFPSTLDRARSDALVDRIDEHFTAHGFTLFAIERKSDRAFLGFTGCLRAPGETPVAGDVEIGWRLASAFWRQGYAYEAASACLEWIWRETSLLRLVSFTSKHNLPSQALMKKLGFGRRSDLDFDHPAIPKENPLCRQVVFVLESDV